MRILNIKNVTCFTVIVLVFAFVYIKAQSKTRVFSYEDTIGLSAIPFPFDDTRTVTNYGECEFKFGYGNVGTTSIAVWDLSGATPYAYIPSATTLLLSSGDVNDSSVSTGARTVTLYGLDSNYDKINEVVSLNGQNAATTDNAYLRVYRMIVNTAGSSATNEGIIYCGTGVLSSGVPATSYAAVSAGEGQSLMCIYTIPNDTIGLLYQFDVLTDTTKTTTVRLMARPSGGIFNVKYKYETKAQGQQLARYPIPMAFDEKTDIELRANVSASTANVAGTFALLLVKKE